MAPSLVLSSPIPRRARGAAAGLVLLLTLVLVGCGAGTNSNTPSEAAPSEAAPTESGESSPVASEPTGEDVLAEWEAAAEEEGPLTFYGSITPAQHEAVIAAFNEVYPNIEVEFLRLSTGELGQRYAAEAEVGQVVADVVSLSDPEWFKDAADAGWLAPIGDLPSLEDVPDQYKQDTWTTFYVTPYVLGYNTELVSESDVPETLEDLLDPMWQGQILMIDPAGSPSQVAWLNLVSELEGMDYLEQLAANELLFTPSGVPGIQQVGAGAAAMLLATPASNVFDQQQAGAPIDFTYLPPITGQVGSMGVSVDAPHPNAARLFANFLLTEPAQEIMARTGTPVISGVEGPFPLADGFEPLDVPAGAERRDELLAALGVQG